MKSLIKPIQSHLQKPFFAVSLALFLLIPLMLIFLAFFFTAPPANYTSIKEATHSSWATITDREGQLLEAYRTDFSQTRLEWIKIEEIPTTLKNKIISMEDKRFYSHFGIDIISLLHSSKNFFKPGKKMRGASTITMQLVSLLYPHLKKTQGNLPVGKKILQMIYALKIEHSWKKEQILEAYLNLVDFRGGVRGIKAAAIYLFEKDLEHISNTDATALAILIREPNIEPQKLSRKICFFQNISPQDCIEEAYLVTKSKNYSTLHKSFAPHFARFFWQKKKHLNLHSTLNLSLQKTAARSLNTQLNLLKNKNVSDGAVLAVHNKTGEVYAYIGGNEETSLAKYVDMMRAQRQAGSSLKPFLYALALEKRLVTAASPIMDSPFEVVNRMGSYQPENYDKKFKGAVTVREALGNSLNIPAVKTIDLLGVGNFLSLLNSLGFTKLSAENDYGHSLALGSADISLWELVNAYRTLANDGIFSELSYTMPSEEDSQKTQNQNKSSKTVFSAETAFVIKTILSDKRSRGMTFGLDNLLATPFWTAVKTGTSKDMRDNWCVGFSQNFTVGVWVGNADGSPMWDVSGIDGAAPVWLEVIATLEDTQPNLHYLPRIPDGIIAQNITDVHGLSYKEYFLQGTEPLANAKIARKPESLVRASIKSPIAGDVYAIDADLPLERQKIFLESSRKEETLFWQIDGKRLASAKEIRFYTLTRGKHLVELVTLNGEKLDSVEFTVVDSS